jgi:Beta-lactamase
MSLRPAITLSLLALVLALVVPAARSAAAARRLPGAQRPDLQRALDRVVAAGAPGAVLLVRDGNRTIRLTSGYGNLQPKTPMRAGDRFRVGSITKTFVATIVLQLVNERRLALENTVERWQLLRARADRRSGDQASAGGRASRAHLRTSSVARHELGQRSAHHRPLRARILPPPARRRQRREPLGSLGGGRARLQRRRSRPLLPRPLRGTPRSPRPPTSHGNGSHARTGLFVRTRPAEAARAVRLRLGPHRRQPRLRGERPSTARTASVRSSCSSKPPPPRCRLPSTASSSSTSRTAPGPRSHR